VKQTRRKLLTTFGSTFGISLLHSGGDEKLEQCGETCMCGGYIQDSRQIYATQTTQTPDFIVAGINTSGESIEVPVYWKGQAEFERIGNGYGNAIGLAFGGNREEKIWLNESYKDKVDQTIVVHEFGHIIGYGHIDGTIMGPSLFTMDDYYEKTELTETTRDVIYRINGAKIMDWSTNEVIMLGNVASDFAQNKADITTLNIAANRYAGYLDSYDSVYFRTTWNNYGGMKKDMYMFYSEKW
jgi:hypothetical protein